MRFLVRRIGFYLIAAWASITLNFLLPRMMPGDPADGALAGRIVHYRRPEEGIAALRQGEIAAFMGLRSQVESGLGADLGRFALDPIPLTGPAAATWAVGGAVRENARDQDGDAKKRRDQRRDTGLTGGNVAANAKQDQENSVNNRQFGHVAWALPPRPRT